MQREGTVVRFHPVSVIGEGPQGEVFVGVDEVLRRRVVVKKIVASSMSRESRSRLIVEAQALCRLNHPNILQIYKYAEEDGNDVFTFEFAAGKKLPEVLAQKIDFNEKVRIAIAIASALVVAHRNGITHGALSSSSVLIAESGGVKLTDFPSMSTTFDRLRAESGEVRAYAEDLTSHTSDMQAFGRVLREMFGETDRDIRALTTSLLHDAPSERPTAAEALAKLQRVASRRARFIRASAVAAVFVLFVIGAIKYTIDLRRERSEAIAAKAEAESHRDRANELVAYMIKDIRTKLGHAGRLDIMDATSDKVLSHFQSVQPDRISPAEASMNVQALVQVGGAQIARGRLAAARVLLQQAITLGEATLARHPHSDEVRFSTATAHGVMGTALYHTRDLNGAIQHARVFAAMMKEVVKRHPDNADYVRNLASAHSNLGSYYEWREDIEASLREVELAVAVKRRALLLEDNTENRFDLAVPIHKMGVALLKLGRLEEARKTLELERANLDALLARNNTQWRLRELVTVFDHDLFLVALAMGDVKAASRHAAAYLATATQLTSFDADNVDWKRRLAEAHRCSGTIARMTGDTAAAVQHHAEAVEILSAMFARGTQTNLLVQHMMASRIELARSLLASGRTDAAITQANLAVEGSRPLQEDRVGQRLLGEALLVQGEMRAAHGGHAAAAASWQEALRVLVPLDQISPDPHIADTHARVLLRLGRMDAAQPLIEQLNAVGYRNREFEALYQSKGTFVGS